MLQRLGLLLGRSMSNSWTGGLWPACEHAHLALSKLDNLST